MRMSRGKVGGRAACSRGCNDGFLHVWGHSGLCALSSSEALDVHWRRVQGSLPSLLLARVDVCL